MNVNDPAEFVTRRRPKRPAHEYREQLIGIGRSTFEQCEYPVIAALPSLESTIAKAQVPRSAAFRNFPQRQDFDNAVILDAIQQDPYKSAALQAAGAELISSGIEQRSIVVAKLGGLCVATPRHVAAARLEAIVSSMPAIGEDPSEAAAELAGRRTAHLHTVRTLLEQTHGQFNESIGQDIDGRTSYEIAFAGLARNFALQPYGEVDALVQAQMFTAMADAYTASQA